MRSNPWLGQEQHGAKDDPRLTRISPYFFSQHGLSNIYYLPKLRDLPQKGLDLKALVFDFGFDVGTTPVPTNGSAKYTIGVERPLLIWGITNLSNFNTPANPATPRPLDPAGVGYQFQILHSHEGKQRQFYSKHHVPQIAQNNRYLQVNNNPLLLRMPYLVLKGDEITCQVRNTTPQGPLDVQVVLYGGEFD